jgi:predicted small integral membrane protein
VSATIVAPHRPSPKSRKRVSLHPLKATRDIRVFLVLLTEAHRSRMGIDLKKATVISSVLDGSSQQ